MKWKRQKMKNSERVSESRGVRETAEASDEQNKLVLAMLLVKS